MLDAHAHVMQVKLCKANTRGVTYSMDHVNFALDCKLLKATHYNGSMFIHKVRKVVFYQSSLSTTFSKG